MNDKEKMEIAIEHGMKLKNELEFSYNWMSLENIDRLWVIKLKDDEIKNERVTAFCARFGKFQDYLSDKIIPRWLIASGERAGVAMENFSIAERAGILSISSERMIEIRKLRNDLTHDYIEDPEELAADLNEILSATKLLIQTLDNLVNHYNRVIACQGISKGQVSSC